MFLNGFIQVVLFILVDAESKLYEQSDLLFYIQNKSHEDEILHTRLLQYLEPTNYEDLDNMKLKIMR